MQDVYKNIGDYNPSRKCNVLIVFDDLIADMISKKIPKPFIRGRKLNICPVFLTQSYFQVPKNVILNCTHFFHYENSKQTRTSINCI